MPFEELLALYGYEASDPISEQDSESNDVTPNLPDMTLDKVRAVLEETQTWAYFDPLN